MTRNRSMLGAVILTLLAVVTAGAPTGAPAGASAPLPGPGLCGALTEIALPSGGTVCTHGSDPPPEGADVKVSQPPVTRPPAHPPGTAGGLILPDSPPNQTAAAAAAPPSIRCYGDGQSGNRVHAVYARPADRPDRYGQFVASIRQWAAETDAVFAASAARTGGVRHIRFLTDPACGLVVDNVVLSSSADDTFENSVVELDGRGYNRSDRKYMVWMDATVLCGIAGYYVDDRLTSNFNDGSSVAPGVVARTDAGCWGLAGQGESVEAHELMHSLGSVMPTAPHMTAAGHCRDDNDRMCYEDGLHITMLSVCAPAGEALFDCGNDDYFHTGPPAGNYLASHWNTARSTFLSAESGDPLISIGDIVVGEGDSETVTAVFQLSLDTATGAATSVSVSTADGTAAGTGDYEPTSLRLQIQPGQTSTTFAVPVRGDTEDEANETFSVTLSAPLGARLGDGSAVGTIVDDDPKRKGYWLVANDGGIFAFGQAAFHGSTGNIRLNRPINGMVGTPSTNGYWMVADDGGIFAFGDAGFFGSTGDRVLDRPVIGMATTPAGGGYWLAGSGGQVFAFGDAPVLGGLSAPPAAPVVGIAVTATGRGYWLVGRDGRVYPFGDAGDFGSANVTDAVGMAAAPGGAGYWIVTRSGTVYGKGNAPAFPGGERITAPITGIAASPTGGGYWMVGTDGEVYALGDAPDLGSMGGIPLTLPVVGMSAMR